MDSPNNYNNMAPSYQALLTKYKFRQEDFTQYKKMKKYYLEGSEEQAIRASQEQQEYLKQYKFYQDLPRADVCTYGMHRSDSFKNVLILLSLPVSFFAGRLFAVEYYGIYNTSQRVRMCRIGTFFGLMSLGKIYINTTTTFTPQNSWVYEPQFIEKKIQRRLDEELNLYQNVNKIIYEDVEPTWAEYREVVNNIKQRQLNMIKTNNDF